MTVNDFQLQQIIPTNGGSRIYQMGAPTLEGGTSTYYWANFDQKLHENEENMAGRDVLVLSCP